MKFYKLTLNEKRGEFSLDKTHERFIRAKNRGKAYDKSLKTVSLFFNDYLNGSIGKPDKDMIFWFDGNHTAIWIKSLEELKII